MKKILFTGIVILLAVFFVTCEEFFPEETKVEYTNVVYSPDGSEVRLYLDGIGVPVTKAQRAMSLDLAKMAYDYLEVIFNDLGSTPVIAIAQWELGQSPTISGVKRANTNYQGANITSAYAYMAVGTKDQKTLLGVGKIINVGEPGAATPTPGSALTNTASYVTFGLSSVKTGLLIGNEVADNGDAIDDTNEAKGVMYNSLDFITTTVSSGVPPAGTTIKTNATRSPLGDASYPMYPIPTGTGGLTGATATYKFGGAADTYSHALDLARDMSIAPPNTPKGADVEKRIPRYMDGGRYLIPKSNINTKSKVELGTYGSYSNTVPLTFTFSGTGIFSFYIDIPVCLVKRTLKGTNSGQLSPVTWHLRTGFGSELYSLDDGISSGGCVLMGIGVSSLDWLEIRWEWQN